MYRLGIITHYNLQTSLVPELDVPGIQLVSRVAVSDAAITCAQELETTEKVDAILTLPEIQRIIEHHVGVPIVPLYLSSYDLLRSFHSAKEITSSIAFVEVEKMDRTYDLSALEEILNGKIQSYYLTSRDDIDVMIDRIIADGYHVIVSFAGCLLKRARRRALDTILVKMDPAEVLNAIERARSLLNLLQTARPTGKQAKLNGKAVVKYTFQSVIGKSAPIQQLLAKAKRFSNADSNILICGESGTGKEIFAQSIHNGGRYRDTPFIGVNCSAIPDELIESEFFGYSEGSFTGAVRGGRPGLFELANGGTLFLDEIGDMPLKVQAKLLRVLQEKNMRRIGGNQDIPIDVRIISATNRDLQKMVWQGTFREDLYYRINVLNLTIPPLRLRPDDIRPLAENFLKRLEVHYGEPICMTDAQYKRLTQYPWPGNVRELQNFLERFAIMAGTPAENTAIFDELFDTLRRTNDVLSGEVLAVPLDTLDRMELFIIRTLLAQHRDNKTEVAHILGMSATTLWRRLKEDGLNSSGNCEDGLMDSTTGV